MAVVLRPSLARCECVCLCRCALLQNDMRYTASFSFSFFGWLAALSLVVTLTFFRLADHFAVKLSCPETQIFNFGELCNCLNKWATKCVHDVCVCVCSISNSSRGRVAAAVVCGPKRPLSACAATKHTHTANTLPHKKPTHTYVSIGVHVYM